ncbi:MAG: ABC-2 transporter permease [Eubacteriales bacterium]|nr:ABC-2 transporter permease [Eubacteriales bacterium]
MNGLLGLLIKDFKFFRAQRIFFLIILAIAGISVFSSSDFGASFLLIYFTVGGATFVISTIGLDEAENGSAFLFALPFSRRTYVIEKYIFALLISAASWLIAALLRALFLLLHGMTSSPYTVFVQAFPVLLSALFMLVFLLPLTLHFGREKASIAMMAVVFLAVILIGALPQLPALQSGVLRNINLLAETAAQITVPVLLFSLAGTLLLFALSGLISLAIIERKEF